MNLSFDFWQIHADVAKMYFLRFQSNKLNYRNVLCLRLTVKVLNFQTKQRLIFIEKTFANFS